MRQVGNNVACIAVLLAANLDEALWFYLPPGTSLTQICSKRPRMRGKNYLPSSKCALQTLR